jgi:asparagine synthase (glutamine-hydrolysing)
VPHRDAIDLMGRLDLDTWLPDNLLERGDRMSMAASLELRPPYLDHRLVELAFRLPSSVKVRDGQTKWVLKQVARRHLPDQIVFRPKVGFQVPLDAWFRGELQELARDLLRGGDSFVDSLMDSRVVGGILDDHARGRRDEEIRIWTLLSLEIWGRCFFGSRAPVAS